VAINLAAWTKKKKTLGILILVPEFVLVLEVTAGCEAVVVNLEVKGACLGTKEAGEKGVDKKVLIVIGTERVKTECSSVAVK
jgi:hypothetical protein